MCLRWTVIAVFLLLGSGCADSSRGSDDSRCQDPHIGSVELASLSSGPVEFEPVDSTSAAASEGFCDGSEDIKLVVMDALGPGALSDFLYLAEYEGAFLLIDGKCHFYAFSYGSPRLKTGVLSTELLAQLTADLRLDELPELPSSKDTLFDHYGDTLLATPTHSLRCRDLQCRTAEATAAIERASGWIAQLSAMGGPRSRSLFATTPSMRHRRHGHWSRPCAAWPDWWSQTPIRRRACS
jgi:hypothetical protein